MADVIHDLLEILSGRFRDIHGSGTRMVLAVAGSVAVGKSTFAEELRSAIADWPERPRVEVVPIDGFLYSNAMLAARALSMRKGFPESYDVDALKSALARIKQGGEVRIPLYSHVTYDVHPSEVRTVDAAEIVILDGLHLGRVKVVEDARLIDALIYLDADEQDIERWFRDRLIPLMQAGRTDPGSFYYAFRTLDDAGISAFTDRVWREINLPNLRDYIVHDRNIADFVLRKRADHRFQSLEARHIKS